MVEQKSILKAAICEFKKKGISIKKETSNPFFKSKYADLATILDAIEVDAASCGLVIISTIARGENGMELITNLEHKDSDEVRTSVFPIFGGKPQEIGSSVTYARRYNIQTLLNLAAEDDDGNAANEAAPIKSVPAKYSFKSPKERTALYTEIMLDLNNSKDLEDLQSIWISRTEDLNKLKGSDAQIFHQLEDRKNEIKKTFTQMEQE